MFLIFPKQLYKNLSSAVKHLKMIKKSKVCWWRQRKGQRKHPSEQLKNPKDIKNSCISMCVLIKNIIWNQHMRNSYIFLKQSKNWGRSFLLPNTRGCSYLELLRHRDERGMLLSHGHPHCFRWTINKDE